MGYSPGGYEELDTTESTHTHTRPSYQRVNSLRCHIKLEYKGLLKGPTLYNTQHAG